jgi:hypothetical protein
MGIIGEHPHSTLVAFLKTRLGTNVLPTICAARKFRVQFPLAKGFGTGLTSRTAMIHDRLEKIAADIRGAQNIPDEKKAELLNLLSGLKTEIEALSKTHGEDARSITGFAGVSASEATRAGKKPRLVSASLDGLTSSVEGFEVSHPRLTQLVNRLAVILSDMGI